MIPLNLPKASLRISSKGNTRYVFDIVRKKNVVLTPEEWVRQHFLWYLIDHLHYPRTLIKIESGHAINTLAKRTDILVYNREFLPTLLVECKATTIPLKQAVFEQVLLYNRTIQSEFVVVTNGLQHQCFRFKKEAGHYSSEIEIPSFIEG